MKYYEQSHAAASPQASINLRYQVNERKFYIDLKEGTVDETPANIEFYIEDDNAKQTLYKKVDLNEFQEGLIKINKNTDDKNP